MSRTRRSTPSLRALERQIEEKARKRVEEKEEVGNAKLANAKAIETFTGNGRVGTRDERER